MIIYPLSKLPGWMQIVLRQRKLIGVERKSVSFRIDEVKRLKKHIATTFNLIRKTLFFAKKNLPPLYKQICVINYFKNEISFAIRRYCSKTRSSILICS